MPNTVWFVVSGGCVKAKLSINVTPKPNTAKRRGNPWFEMVGRDTEGDPFVILHT
jgi:hypothetical protein